MQQAYQVLRVVSEAQTVHIVLANQPGALMLEELCAACQALQAGSGEGIKAVVLDFAGASGIQQNEARQVGAELADSSGEAVRAIPQPVLAVVRASLSALACRLVAEADFTLIAHEAELCVPGAPLQNAGENSDNRVSGVAAARLGYATWSAPAAGLNQELERILDMLRSKSAVALRHAKASTRRPAATASDTSLEALRKTNQFYLEKVMATQDAREGLQAFLEKRAPRWNNR